MTKHTQRDVLDSHRNGCDWDSIPPRIANLDPYKLRKWAFLCKLRGAARERRAVEERAGEQERGEQEERELSHFGLSIYNAYRP
jgi:hypothetical protein